MRYLPPVLFFAFICWIIYETDMGMYNPFVAFTKTIPHGDKFAHFLLYGCLTFLVNYSSNFSRVKIGGYPILVGIVAVGAFAFLEELTQIGFATRNFQVLDLISDALGILFFSWLSLYFFENGQEPKTPSKPFSTS